MKNTFIHLKAKICTTVLILMIVLTAILPNIIPAKPIREIQTKKIENIKNLCPLSELIDNMEAGDILISLPGKESQYGHCRIFTGYNSSRNRYSFVNSYYHVIGYSLSKFGVSLAFLSITYSWGYDGITIVRVNATSEQKQNAADFAKVQVGKRFDFRFDRGDKNFNPEDTTDHNADEWYCSELPWASYYNCNNSFPKKEPEGGYIYGEGIDVDVNGWEKDCSDHSDEAYSFVHPLDIINDDDTQIINTWIRPSRRYKYN